MSKHIKTIKAARGIEREEHFKNGGSLVSWRGGARTITRNRKTYSRKGKSKWKQENQSSINTAYVRSLNTHMIVMSFITQWKYQVYRSFFALVWKIVIHVLILSTATILYQKQSMHFDINNNRSQHNESRRSS